MPLHSTTSVTPLPQPRELICAACGAAFSCTMDEHCWCAAEPAQLPLPTDGADCLCPACLRQAATADRPT